MYLVVHQACRSPSSSWPHALSHPSHALSHGQVYDLVDDNEYQDLVDRRRHADDFLVDDDGLGYVDYGEEEWEGEASDGEEVAQHSTKRVKAPNGGAAAKKAAPTGKKLTNMLGAFVQSGRAIMPSHVLSVFVLASHPPFTAPHSQAPCAEELPCHV